MINRKKLSRKLVLVLLSACAVTASGCRLSPVLEQVVYEQNHNIDQDQESKDDQEDNQDEDQQMESKKQVDDSESQQGQEKDDAVSGDGNAQSDTVYGGSYRDGAKTNGTDNTSPENQTEAGGGAATGNQTGGTGNGTNYEPGTTGDKSIEDARGVTVQIPENVASVTAPGELGLMVEMLGGSNRLLASSNSLTENSLAKQAFSGQGIFNVKNWWSGTGTGQISDADFQALLNSKPDVCLEISGYGSFTSAQVTQLENAGITYFVMPKLDSVDHIKEAVTLMGTILGDKSSGGGTNAPMVAKQYCDWADKVVKLARVTDSNNQKYSLYISAWDTDAYWSTWSKDDGLGDEGYGVAIAANSDSVAALNSCLNTALVNNTQTSTRDQYVNPLKNLDWLQKVTGDQATYGTPGNYARTDDSDNACYLGSKQFPAIIVANQSIKTAILNDKHWTSYGKNPSGSNSFEYGYTDQHGKFVPSNIHGNYEIYINPSGIGDWVAGSVETPLEAAWVSCKLQGQCSLEQVRNLASEFYKTFYHLDNVNTADILGE